MNKAACLFFMALLVSGCATTAKYEAQLNTWIGVSEDALIAAWGAPDSTYDMQGGKRAISYVRKTTVQSGGYTYTRPQTVYQSGTLGGQPYSGKVDTYVTEVVPVQNQRFYCKTSFIIGQSGKVESWHHEGNNCVSP